MNEKQYTLRLRQNYPLDMKIHFTKLRIKHGDCINFGIKHLK